MNRFGGTTTRVVIALLSLATVVLPNAAAIATAAACPGVSRSGHWVTHRVEFESGGPLVSYLVAPFNRSLMFATDGVDVLRTKDAGCAWKKVYSVSDATPVDYGFRGDAARILSMELSAGGQRIWLRIEENAGAVNRPHVVGSEDGGDTWTAKSAGLPPAGQPESLTVGQANPLVAYMGIDVGGGTLDLVYGTTDGGETWTSRNDLTQTLGANAGIAQLEVDPITVTDLYAYGPGGLYRSENGGASFTVIDEFAAQEVTDLEVFHSPTRQNPYLLAFQPLGGGIMRASDDKGDTWVRTDTPGTVPYDGSATGLTPYELMISSRGRIFLFDPAANDWIGLQVPRPGIGHLTADYMPERDFWGSTASTIEQYTGPTRESVGPPGGGGGPVFDVDPLSGQKELPPPAPPALGPTGRKLKIKTGAKQTIDYTLKLSEKRTKLDVFFLLDTSDSMSGTIQGLINSVEGIITALNATGIDAQYGIGESRAYTDTAVPRQQCQSETETGCERNFIYRRQVNLEEFTNGDALEAALANLHAEAGGRFDSQLAALDVILSGREINDGPPTMEPSDVPAGQQANFRGEDTLKVVFLATDEPFGDEQSREGINISDFGRVQPPDIPEPADVAAAYKARGVVPLGLAITQGLDDKGSTTGGGPTPLVDLRNFASLAGALAPAGGVDCNGDGVPEIAEGEPLVCPVRRKNVESGENLSKAIVKLVDAVRGTTSYELEITGGEDVVAGITPATHEGVVLQKSHLLDFEVTYRCPDRLQGENVKVRLAATSEGRTLDSAITTVSCLKEKVPRDILPIEPLALFAFVPPFIPPAPPPIEIAPSAQGQAQTQSQAQAQGAMAHQEQEQPQLAYVNAAIDPREAEQVQEELAMSDYRRRTEAVPQWATLGTGAVLMSLAYGWLVLARQQNVRVQYAGVRRRRRY